MVAAAGRREAGYEPTSTILARPSSSSRESFFGPALYKDADDGLRAHRRNAARARRREGSTSPTSLLYKIARDRVRAVLRHPFMTPAPAA